VRDGVIRSRVHLTELPIGELDRIRVRKHTVDQVAIGFPRRFLQTKKIAPVLYTKYNPELTAVLTEVLKNPEVRRALTPFLDMEGDTSSFLELRTTEDLPIEHAVWLLTSSRKDIDGNERPWVPGLEEFQRNWGRISVSYWERSHQIGVLSEWHFLETRRDSLGQLEDAVTIGEHYWEKHCTQEEIYNVTMPARKSWDLRFPTIDADLGKSYQGPMRFIDLAKRFKGLLAEIDNAPPALPFALMPDLRSVRPA
jgi:hypothetical protein